MKARYLMFFSYLGTGFRGAEKRWKKGALHNTIDLESIQGVLEVGLNRLKPLSYPRVVLSSRTDAGVHALNSSAHTDLECYGKSIYKTANIKQTLNKYFKFNNISVNINKTLQVDDSFNARKRATSRTYLYRFAVCNKVSETEFPASPIEEWKRCTFFRDRNFDIEKFIEAGKYFPGYHDFRTFQKHNKELVPKSTRRTLYSLEVRPGRSIVTSHTERNQEIPFDFWEVEFKGRGFVHNQIRRIIGAMRAVATDRIKLEEIQLMLQIPSKHSWPTAAANASPDGLYLCNVEYDPKDLVLSENNSVSERNSDRLSESDDEATAKCC